MNTINVAAAQVPVAIGDHDRNLSTVSRIAQQAAEQDISLVVFPEAFLTGYVVDDRRHAEQIAIDADASTFADTIARACDDNEIYLCVGYLERVGGRLFNSALLAGPSGQRWIYRKRHLPQLGADRFVDEPDETIPMVVDTSIGKIGMAICYEIRFPEVIRTLALAGADIVALPTAWPLQSMILAEHFTLVRAAENFVYLVAANRGDSENGTVFLGHSTITDPRGRRLAVATNPEQLIVASIDVAEAREKRIVFEPGTFEISPWVDRRPATYQLLGE